MTTLAENFLLWVVYDPCYWLGPLLLNLRFSIVLTVSQEPCSLFHPGMLMLLDCFSVMMHYISYEASMAANNFRVLTIESSAKVRLIKSSAKVGLKKSSAKVRLIKSKAKVSLIKYI